MADYTLEPVTEEYTLEPVAPRRTVSSAIREEVPSPAVEESSSLIPVRQANQPETKALAPEQKPALERISGALSKASAMIAETGRTLTDPRFYSEVVGGTARDAAAVVAKTGAGVLRGMTLGGVDLERGTLTTPLTTDEVRILPPLTKALEEVGVSEEIAKNRYVSLPGEAMGAALPWGKIATGISTGINALRAARAGGQELRALSAIERVGIQTATGAVFGAAQARGPGENIVENSLTAAAAGAVLSAAHEGGVAIAKAQGWGKANAYNLWKEQLSKMYQEGSVEQTSKMGTEPFSKAEADRAAEYTLKADLAAYGGKPPSPAEFRALAKKARKARQARRERPATPPQEPPIYGEAPATEQKLLPGEPVTPQEIVAVEENAAAKDAKIAELESVVETTASPGAAAQLAELQKAEEAQNAITTGQQSENNISQHPGNDQLGTPAEPGSGSVPEQGEAVSEIPEAEAIAAGEPPVGAGGGRGVGVTSGGKQPLTADELAMKYPPVTEVGKEYVSSRKAIEDYWTRMEAKYGKEVSGNSYVGWELSWRGEKAPPRPESILSKEDLAEGDNLYNKQQEIKERLQGGELSYMEGVFDDTGKRSIKEMLSELPLVAKENIEVSVREHRFGSEENIVDITPPKSPTPLPETGAMSGGPVGLEVGGALEPASEILDSVNPTGGVFSGYSPQERMRMKLGDNITTLPNYEAQAKEAGVTFNGVQKSGVPKVKDLPLFTDPVTKSTFSLAPGETVNTALLRTRKKFGIEPTVHEETLAAFDKHLAEGDITPELHESVKDIVDIQKGHGIVDSIEFLKDATHTSDNRKLALYPNIPEDRAILINYGKTEEEIDNAWNRAVAAHEGTGPVESPYRVYGEIRIYDRGERPIGYEIKLYSGARAEDAYHELGHSLINRKIIDLGPKPEGVTQTAHEEAGAWKIADDLMAGKREAVLPKKQEAANVRSRQERVSKEPSAVGGEGGKADIAPRENGIRAEGGAPGSISKTAAGSKVTAPARTYPEGVTAKGNVWIRQSNTDSNAGRQLLMQFSTELINKDFPTDASTKYYDSLYSGQREGYLRLRDFWEIPQWMGYVSNYLPSADVYVVRDMIEAGKFLNEAGYDRVIFSAIDVNKEMIKTLAKEFKGPVDIGGYTVPGTFDDIPNAKWHPTLDSLAKDVGVPFVEGVNYRHFEGSKVIPRLTMSQGCLHKCAFCTVPKDLVATDTAIVDQQAEAFGILDAKLVYLNDKTFGQAKNYTHLEDVYQVMLKNNPNFKGFIIQTTGSQLNEMDPEWLKRSGIKYVELGVETYNNAILKSLHKPHNEAILDKAAQRLRELDIALIPNIIIGLPGETAATYARTMEFLEKNTDIISHANIYNLALYAGTEMGETIKGTVASDFNEAATEKSFHADEQIHKDFSEKVYAQGMRDIGKKQFSIRDSHLVNSGDPIIDRIVAERWPELILAKVKGRKLPQEFRGILTNILKGRKPAGELANLESDARKGRIPEAVPEAFKNLIISFEADFREPDAGSQFSIRPTIEKEVRKEMRQIVAEARKNKTYLKAPDGDPSLLSPEQWAIVRTKNFKGWFGDWEKGNIWGRDDVSKVVDMNGEPLIVYHGTQNGGFSVFDPDKRHHSHVPSTFFTSSREMAATYSGTKSEIALPVLKTQKDLEDIGWTFEERDGYFQSWGSDGYMNDDAPTLKELVKKALAEQENLPAGEEKGLYPVFLNIRNPEEMDFEGANWDGTRYGQYTVEDEDGDPIERDGKIIFDEDTANAIAEETGGTVETAGDVFLSTNDVVGDAKRSGEDGAIIRNVTDSGGKSGYYDFTPADVFVIFKPEQAKSATWNIGTFNPKSEDVRYSIRDTFYSKLTKEAESQELPAKAQALVPYLLKKGVKPAEMQWMGVDQWVKENQKDGRIDRDAFRTFLAQNQIEMKEVTKADGKINVMDGGNVLKSFDDWTEADSWRNKNHPNAAIDDSPATKFSDPRWQIPGGTNYKEMLFTLPVKMTQRGRLTENEEVRLNILLGMSSNKRTSAEETEMNRLLAIDNQDFSEKKNVVSGPVYLSPHWDEPNVVGHVRMNDRGDTLNIEEVQSDWHQEGKKKGYQGALEVPPGYIVKEETLDGQKLYALGKEGDKEVQAHTGYYPELETAIREITKQFPRYERVPQAPFAENWHEVLLKRMLRYAVDNGYSKMTFPTGEVQADRYDLSKQVEEVAWMTRENGDKGVGIFLPDGQKMPQLTVDISGRIIDGGQFNGRRLEDAIGKDAAKKVMADSKGSISGLGLKVGGEGMRVFYDEKIPGFLNKYLKQWGGKVEKGTIEGKAKNGGWGYRVVDAEGETWNTYRDRAEAQQYVDSMKNKLPRLKVIELGKEQVPVWEVKITPQMQEGLQKPQALFSIRELGDKVKAAFEKNEITKILINSPKIKAGPLDGGCRVLARALERIEPAGNIVTLESKVKGKWQAEHYGFEFEGGVTDALGYAENRKKWGDRFADEENMFIFDRPHRVVDGESPSDEIPQDVPTEKLLAQALRKELNHPDIPDILYVGTDDSTVMAREEKYSEGYWFTQDPGDAQDYGRNIFEARVTIKNPAFFERTNGDTGVARAIADAKSAGHDGLVVSSPEDGDENGMFWPTNYVAFDISQMHILSGNAYAIRKDDKINNPAQKYLAAVEDKDMGTAQKMVDEAAEAAGYLVHVTPEGNVAKLLKDGIRISRPTDMEDSLGVYLFKSKVDAEDAIMNWLGDRYNEDVELSLVYVNPAGVGETYTDEAAGFEVISKSPVPAKYVESADPVTYNDEGNVIPLFERFNEKSPNIRYAIRKDDKINNPAPVVAKIKKGDHPESWAKIEEIAKKRGQFRRVTEEQQAVILAALVKAPTVSELAATAWAGRAARWWYADDMEFFKKNLGDDAYKFFGVMAATSPQAKAETENIRYGVNAWTDYIALRDKLGREPDSTEIDALVEKMDIGMPMRRSGVARALKGEQLGASEGVLKTRFYQNALFGTEMGAVLDVWHARQMGQIKFTAAGEEIKISQEFSDSIIYSVLADRMDRAAKTMGLPQSASQAAQWTVIKAIWDKMGAPNRARRYTGLEALKDVTNKDIALAGNYTTGLANYFKADDPIIDKFVKMGIPREEIAKLRPAWEKLKERGIDQAGKIYSGAPPEIKRELERLAKRLEKTRDATDTLKAQEEHVKRREPLLHVTLEVINGALANLPLTKRKALHNEVRKKVLTDSVIKSLGTTFGVKVTDIVDGPGTWYNPATKEVEKNPNFTPLLAVPPGEIKKQMAERIRGFAATLGFANRQEAVGFTHPVATGPLFELNGGPIIFADLGKTITFDQADKLTTSIAELFPEDTAYIVPTKNGVLISMSKRDGKYPLSYEDFGEKALLALDNSVKDVLKEWRSFEKDALEGGDYYEREGIHRQNEQEVPSFERAIGNSGGPRGLNRVRLLLAKIDEIKGRYARVRPGKIAPVVPAVHERAGAVSLTGIHFSRAKRTVLDPKFTGTGFQGVEKKRLIPGAKNSQRLYFYANTGKGIVPEWQAPPYAHEAQLTNVYDIYEDVLGLVPKSKGKLNEFETSVMEAGYSGILDRSRGVVVMLGVKKIPVKYLGLRPDLNKIPPTPSLDINYSIRTPEFKKWFGDSKVVDKKGNPLVVYRGANTDIAEFDMEKYGMAFFTPDKTAAVNYAYERSEGNAGYVFSGFLRMENPLIKNYREEGDNDVYQDAIDAQEEGHDGFIALNTDDGERIIDQYVAFSPTQIKSTGNVGTFDVNDPRINYAIREAYRDADMPTGEGVFPRLLSVKGTFAEITVRAAKEMLTWPKSVVDPEGKNVLLHNPETKAGVTRLDHLTKDGTSGYKKLDTAKAEWLPAVLRTIQEADIKLLNKKSGNIVYVKAYERAKHIVVVDPNGTIKEHGLYDAGLVTQYKEREATLGSLPILWSVGKPQTSPAPLPNLPIASGTRQEAHVKRVETLSEQKNVVKGNYSPAASIREVPETTEIPDYQIALEELIKEEGYEGFAEFKQGEINDLLEETEKILGDRRTQKIKKLIRENTGQTTGSVGNIIEMTEGKALGFALKKAAAAARTAYAAARVEGQARVIEARALGREAKREAVSEAVLKTAAHFMAIAERSKARAALKKLVQGLIKTITKEAGPSVDFKYKEAIEALQAGIDPRMRQAKTLERREATREYLRRNPDAEIPTKLMKLLEAKPLNEWAVKDLQALAAEIDTLRKRGTLKRKLKLAKIQHEHDRNVEEMVKNILKGKPLEPEVAPVVVSTISEGKGRRIITSARAMTLQPARIFDKLDGGKDFRGRTYRLWYSEVNDAENEVLNGIDKRLNATEAVIENLKIKVQDLSKKTNIQGTDYTRDEMLDIYAGWMNERKKLAMMMGNNITTGIYDEIEKSLTATDKALVDHILKEYQDNYDRLRDAFIEFANDDMGAEENYTPMRRMDVTGDPLDQEIADELLLRRGLKKASLEKGFTVHRKNIPQEFQKPIRLGLLQTYMSQVPKQERFIAYAQKIRQLNKFLADKEFKAAVEQQYGREYIEELEKYVARVANPSIYKAMDGLSLLSQEMRHNASIAYLAYNLVTLGNQIPSLALSLGDAGTYHMIASLMEFSKNPAKMIRMVSEKDPQVRHQSLERELEELKKNNFGVYSKIRARLGDPGFLGIYWIDRVVRTTAWNAIYRKELDTGASEKDSVRRAGEAILRIQEGAHPKDISSLYATSEYLNWFLQFTSQLSKIYGNITYDIPAQARQKKYGKAFQSVVGLVLSAVGIWIVQNKRLPESAGDFADAVLDQAIASIPLIGKIIAGAKSGFGDMTPPVLSGAKAVTDAVFAKTRKQRNKKAIEGVTVGLGFPYVGAKRILNTIKEGNPMEMIGPAKSRELKDRSRLMKNLETDLRIGGSKQDLREAVKEKRITPEERTKLLQRSRQTETVAKARKMKVGDLADEIQSASKADQRAMKPIFGDKIQRAKLDKETRKEYLDILRGLGR